MKGGADAPPNWSEVWNLLVAAHASMKGGADAPPNNNDTGNKGAILAASMKGGADAPPNSRARTYTPRRTPLQ